jgi:hypothetical protein
MGDGMLIYFGYPQAHEDDAERAVGRDWCSSKRVAKLRVQEPLQARIAVTTGMVVVGVTVRAISSVRLAVPWGRGRRGLARAARPAAAQCFPEIPQSCKCQVEHVLSLWASLDYLGLPRL